MRVLVTGASGFVGRVVADCLAGAGHDVQGLSRRPADVPGLYGLLAANIADPAAAARIVAGLEPCDAIVHAAAALGRSGRASDMILTNCLGTQVLVDVAKAWDAERFVFISSLPVIGQPRRLPVTEDHPVAPTTPYHASKLFGEQLALFLGPLACVLRLTSVVGPGMAGDTILPTFVAQARAGDRLTVDGDGTRRQDFVDVRDVATSVAAVLAAEAPTGLFNIAAGRSVSNRELAELCVTVLDSKSVVEPSNVPDENDGVDWRISIARASDELGWSPRHPLEGTIRALADVPSTPLRARSGGRRGVTS